MYIEASCAYLLKYATGNFIISKFFPNHLSTKTSITCYYIILINSIISNLGILIGFPFASHCKPGLIYLKQIVLPLNPQTYAIVNTATAMVYRLGCCTCLLHGHLVYRLVCHTVSFQEYLLNDFVHQALILSSL